VKKCPTCGAEFTPTGHTQRYCARGCRKPFGPEYQRQRYLEKQGGSLKPRGAKPDQAKRARVKALREAGLTLVQIAAELGVTHQAVHNMLKKLKAQPPPAAG
jgi:hypothetical protein